MSKWDTGGAVVMRMSMGVGAVSEKEVVISEEWRRRW